MNPLELVGTNIGVQINADLSLTIRHPNGLLLWETSKTHLPTLVVGGADAEPRKLLLSNATASVSAFDDGTYRGHTIRLSGFEGVDVEMELIFGLLKETDQLMIQAAQVGGSDKVISIEHLYRFEKQVSDGGYLVLPHGSGYLIPAECPDELPGSGHKGGFIGGRWTLPMFGMVYGDNGMCAIVETWWDCEVSAEHTPGDQSTLDFRWATSLDELGYPRRFLLRFGEGMDYVAMAKEYRDHARQGGLLRTLEEKAVETPAIRDDINAVLFRWPAWNPDDAQTILEQVRALHEMGFGVKFFFPKWSSAGYTPERGTPTTADSGWQALLLENPVPGGWPELVAFADAVRQLGCTVQGFINPRGQNPEGPGFDEARWPRNSDGKPIHDLSVHDAVERIKDGLDNLEAQGLKYDALYYDGYAAYHPLPEDFSPSHPITRRETYAGQNACFAETRRRGIMPAAELARFWCIPDCDYFFFTDWSSDRLSNTPVQGAPAPVGEPVPLFQLVFHDCYLAGFSGGGYAAYSPGYDWWEDRTPRLYELLFASAPAYNWLPEGQVPIHDLDSPRVQNRFDWLKRWSAYYRAIATEEMVSHKFLSDDRKLQQIAFANGVVATFNMAANLFRVVGVPGFSGEWEHPETL